MYFEQNFVIWKYNQIENLIPDRGDIVLRVKAKISILKGENILNYLNELGAK